MRQSSPGIRDYSCGDRVLIKSLGILGTITKIAVNMSNPDSPLFYYEVEHCHETTSTSGVFIGNDLILQPELPFDTALFDWLEKRND